MTNVTQALQMFDASADAIGDQLGFNMTAFDATIAQLESNVENENPVVVAASVAMAATALTLMGPEFLAAGVSLAIGEEAMIGAAAFTEEALAYNAPALFNVTSGTAIVETAAASVGGFILGDTLSQNFSAWLTSVGSLVSNPGSVSTSDITNGQVVLGSTDAAVFAVDDTISVSSGAASITGSLNNISAGAGGVVSLDGGANTVVAAKGDEVDISGNGEYGATDSVTVTDGDVEISSSAHADITGAGTDVFAAQSDIVGIWSGSDSLTLGSGSQGYLYSTAGNDLVNAANGDAVTESTTGSVQSTDTIDLSGGTVTIASDSPTVVNGSTDSIGLNNDATVTAYGSGLDIGAGSGDNVTAVGANNFLSGFGGNTFNVSGGTNEVIDAPTSVIQIGANTQATINASSGGDTITASSGDTLSIGGNGEYGTSDSATLSNGTIDVGTAAHVDLTGTNLTVDAQQNDIVGLWNGSGNTLSIGSGSAVYFNAGTSNDTVTAVVGDGASFSAIGDSGDTVMFDNPSDGNALNNQEFFNPDGSYSNVSYDLTNGNWSQQTADYTSTGAQISLLANFTSDTSQLTNYDLSGQSWATQTYDYSWLGGAGSVATVTVGFTNGTTQTTNYDLNIGDWTTQQSTFVSSGALSASMTDMINGTSQQVNFDLTGGSWTTQTDDFSGLNDTGSETTGITDFTNGTSEVEQYDWQNNQSWSSSLLYFAATNGTGLSTEQIFNWDSGGSQVDTWNNGYEDYANYSGTDGSGSETGSGDYSATDPTGGGSGDVVTDPVGNDGSGVGDGGGGGGDDGLSAGDVPAGLAVQGLVNTGAAPVVVNPINLSNVVYAMSVNLITQVATQINPPKGQIGGSVQLNYSNQIVGTSYADTFIPGSAAVTLVGGGGSDTINFGQEVQGVTIDLSRGVAVVGTAKDSISGFQTIIGSNYDDTFIAGNTSQVLNGGSGNNAISFAAAAQGVTVNLSNGTAKFGTISDSISNFQIVSGSNYNDTMVASNASETFDGAGGINTISFASLSQGVVANLSANTATSGSDNYLLWNFQNIVGSQYNDVLIAGGAYQNLNGGGGADTFYSYMGGSDTFSGTVANLNASNIQRFVSTDYIDILGHAYTSKTTVSFQSTGASSGILSVTDSTGTFAKIAISGQFASFAAASDGNGGILISDPPKQPAQIENPIWKETDPEDGVRQLLSFPGHFALAGKGLDAFRAFSPMSFISDTSNQGQTKTQLSAASIIQKNGGQNSVTEKAFTGFGDQELWNSLGGRTGLPFPDFRDTAASLTDSTISWNQDRFPSFSTYTNDGLMGREYQPGMALERHGTGPNFSHAYMGLGL